MSGTFIGGSGRLRSSKAIVSFMPGLKSESSGSMPSGESSAAAIAASMSIRPFSGGGGNTIREQGGRGIQYRRADGQALEPERLAGVKERRRRVLVDLDHAGFTLRGGVAALG